MSEFFAFLLEFVCSASGHAILKLFGQRDLKRDETICTLVGLVFWIGIVSGIAVAAWSVT